MLVVGCLHGGTRVQRAVFPELGSPHLRGVFSVVEP